MVVACILARRNSGEADEVSTLTFFKVAFWTARYWDLQCVKLLGFVVCILDTTKFTCSEIEIVSSHSYVHTFLL
jgi:hypothetical protein